MNLFNHDKNLPKESSKDIQRDRENALKIAEYAKGNLKLEPPQLLETLQPLIGGIASLLPPEQFAEFYKIFTHNIIMYYRDYRPKAENMLSFFDMVTESSKQAQDEKDNGSLS